MYAALEVILHLHQLGQQKVRTNLWCHTGSRRRRGQYEEEEGTIEDVLILNIKEVRDKMGGCVGLRRPAGGGTTRDEIDRPCRNVSSPS